MNHELLVNTLTRNYNVFFENVKKMMTKMKQSKEKVNAIALKPDPLSNVDYLDQMIQAEKFEFNREGAKERIEMLKKYKEMALLDEKFESLTKVRVFNQQYRKLQLIINYIFTHYSSEKGIKY